MREILFQTTKKRHQFTNQIVKDENLHLQPLTLPNILCTPGKKPPCSFFRLYPFFPALLTYCIAEHDLCSGSDAGLYHVFGLYHAFSFYRTDIFTFSHVLASMCGTKVWKILSSHSPSNHSLRCTSPPHVCGALLMVAGRSGS